MITSPADHQQIIRAWRAPLQHPAVAAPANPAGPVQLAPAHPLTNDGPGLTAVCRTSGWLCAAPTAPNQP